VLPDEYTRESRRQCPGSWSLDRPCEDCSPGNPAVSRAKRSSLSCFRVSSSRVEFKNRHQGRNSIPAVPQEFAECLEIVVRFQGIPVATLGALERILMIGYQNRGGFRRPLPIEDLPQIGILREPVPHLVPGRIALSFCANTPGATPQTASNCCCAVSEQVPAFCLKTWR